jgi:uncharacterized membrane protein
VNRIPLYTIAFFAIVIGLYPMVYIVMPPDTGLLSTKPPELIDNRYWMTGFYLHISFGGLSLLTGWSQFNKKLRARKIRLHRMLGYIYGVSVLISGVSAFGISFNATGGIISATGFAALAVGWLFTTTTAIVKVRNRNISDHRKWMIRSYCLTFAAVTLRLWMPLLIQGAGMDFTAAYRIIAWLCWVPNLIFAEFLVSRSRHATTEVK